jgi:predicted RND superfamily exporter protein
VSDVLEVFLRHRRWFVTLHLLIALAMLPGIFRLENDNSPEVFFTRDAGAMQHYQRFCREFAGGRAVRIALSGPGLWTRAGLAWLGQLEERTASLPGVEAAVGLAAHHRWLLVDWPPPDPEAFKAEVLQDGLDRGAGWVSPDGETITLLLVLSDLTSPAEKKLLHRLDQLATQSPTGIRTQISGLPVLHRAMDRILIKAAARYLPLLVFMAVAFLAVIFRRAWDVAVPLLFVAVNQTILFGLMGYLGIRLNLVNIILPILLLVIALATAVHLLVDFRNRLRDGMNAPEAVLSAYHSKGWPVLWTGLTTLVAFGSLVTGNTPPIRSVGVWSAVGIALMTILAFTLYPALLAGARPSPARPFEVWAKGRGQAWAHWAIVRRVPVLAGTAVTLAIALVGVGQLRVEDNMGRYLSPHHPLRAGLERLQQHGIGVYAAELILSYRGSPGGTGNEAEQGFQNPSAQKRLAQLSALLRSKPLVYGAVSSGDLVEAALRSLLVEGKVNNNSRWMALGMIQTIPEGRKLLKTLVSTDGQSARLTLLLPMVSFHKLEPLFREVNADAARFFPGSQTWLTGQYPLILLAQGKLLRGLMVSLSLTLLCIILVFFVLLRSVRLTLLVLVPNLWPVALVLGGMGWLHTPLDSASVMTASIALGLAVDDTFHTLGYFLRLVPHTDPASAIETTLQRTAPAHILTSLILAAGFATCALSDFLPIARMGTISTAAIALALLGDLLLIPALLAKRMPPAGQNLFKKRFRHLQKLFIKAGYGFHQGRTLMKTITRFVNNKKFLRGGQGKKKEVKKMRGLKALIPCLHENLNAMTNNRHYDALPAAALHLKKPAGGPKGLIGPPCHGGWRIDE